MRGEWGASPTGGAKHIHCLTTVIVIKHSKDRQPRTDRKEGRPPKLRKAQPNKQKSVREVSQQERWKAGGNEIKTHIKMKFNELAVSGIEGVIRLADREEQAEEHTTVSGVWQQALAMHGVAWIVLPRRACQARDHASLPCPPSHLLGSLTRRYGRVLAHRTCDI